MKGMAVIITDLVSVHLLFLGGKEPKNGWVITVFEFPARKNSYYPPIFRFFFPPIFASASYKEKQIYRLVEK